MLPWVKSGAGDGEVDPYFFWPERGTEKDWGEKESESWFLLSLILGFSKKCLCLYDVTLWVYFLYLKMS